MANWKYSIDLNLAKSSSDTIHFKEFKRIIVGRLESHIKPLSERLNENIGMKYEDIVMYLKHSNDKEEFDENMSTLFDFCDEYRVWIEHNWIQFNIIDEGEEDVDL